MNIKVTTPAITELKTEIKNLQLEVTIYKQQLDEMYDLLCSLTELTDELSDAVYDLTYQLSQKHKY